MSIAHIERYFIDKGATDLADIAASLRREASTRLGIDDVPLPGFEAQKDIVESPKHTEQVFPAKIETFSTMEEAVDVFKNAWEANTQTPELIDKFYQTFWKDRQDIAKKQPKGPFRGWQDRRLLVERRNNAIELLRNPLNIPACDRTAGELAALWEQNRAVILMPAELMQPQGAAMIGELFPIAAINSYKSITNNDLRGGCVDVEMNLQSLSVGVDLHELESLFQEQGRIGQRYPTYIVASHISHLLTGHHFDENSDTALLGSRLAKYSLVNISNERLANGNPFYIYQGRSTKVGYRSEGFK